MSFVAVGVLELLLLTGGGGLLGLPPGEADAVLQRAVPAEALVYVGWTERGPGREGAAGIEGLLADPEVKTFLGAVQQAMQEAIERQAAAEPQNQRPEQVFLRVVPALVLNLMDRPGCLYITADAEKMAAAVAEGQKNQNQPFTPLALVHLHATLIINAGDRADDVEKQLGELLDTHPLIVRNEKLEHQVIPIPVPEARLTLHREGDYFILGFGEGTIERAVSGLKGEAQNGLYAEERFVAAHKKGAVERTGSVTWIDVRRLLSTAETVMGEQAAMVKTMTTAAGLDRVDSVLSATGLEDGRIRTRTFIKTDGSTEGVLSLAAGEGITADDFTRVPADADFVQALSLDPAKILDAVRKAITTAEPQSLDALNALLAQLERELGGISIEEDIFQAFGPVFVAYDSPSAGGVLVTGLVGSLEVRDRAKAEKVFTELMRVLKQSLPIDDPVGSRLRGVRLERETFLERTVYFVNTFGEDDMLFAPTFCLTEQELLIAPHPQAIKAHLRFLDGGGKNFSERFGELPRPEGELLSIMHLDTETLVRYLYAMAPYVAQVVFSEIQSEGVEINVFTLPSARAVLPYVDDSVASVVRTEDGVVFDSAGGIPLPGGAAATGHLPMLLLGIIVAAGL
ncbi:MAG: hypothetical protein ACREJB_16815 [Planctomycetaceae bacterium]